MGGTVGVFVVHGVAKEQCGRCQDARDDPNSSQRCPHVALGAQLGAGQRVDNGQVAVQAHASEAEDAGIHIEQYNVAGCVHNIRCPPLALSLPNGEDDDAVA
uniref:Uncharacterized protein n=1 Tax=Pygocentrus nattereri TaxID=42514 RepID=A0A3B4BVN7_PYGNA